MTIAGRSFIRRSGTIAASLLLLLTGVRAAAAPDYVVFNARVVTVDPAFSIAQAFAVEDGRFLAVGSNDDMLALADAGTRRIDMDGQTILPGFNDTHAHIAFGRQLEMTVDLTDIHSIRDIQDAISARVARSRPGEWIVGTRGWWENHLAEGRLPTRADLDAVAPDNPVSIPGPHYVIANSLALRLAGVTRDTRDPQGGEVWKDPQTGEPTGLLMDNARDFVRRLYPEPTHEQQLAGLRRMFAIVNRNGVTSAADAAGSPEDMALYRELHRNNQLNLRLDFSYNVNPAAPLDQTEAFLRSLPAPGWNTGDGMLRSDQLGEVGLDGAELTALLSQDYPARPGYRGLQKIPFEQFDRFAALANRLGWRLRPHAVGDAAIDQALRSFEFANRERPIAERRWMIDHAFLLRPRHYADVRRLGVIINSQYMHNYQLGELILRAWERPLADQSERYRDWIDNGIRFANGSDGPFLYHAEPILQIYGSVTRNTDWGGRLGPDQGISREEAIRSVTINGAYTTFEENVKGSIEPGKYADFVVLSDDILTVPEERMRDVRVRATVLGGRAVFGDLDAPGRAQP
jgi:predicted amidohydrolase YtcJ